MTSRARQNRQEILRWNCDECCQSDYILHSFFPEPGIPTSWIVQFSEHAQSNRFVFSPNHICWKSVDRRLPVLDLPRDSDSWC